MPQVRIPRANTQSLFVPGVQSHLVRAPKGAERSVTKVGPPEPKHDMEQQLARIQNKIALRGLEMNPAAPESEVVAYEAKHGITLPADYRLFITTIGNGGQGPPFHGLAALGTTGEDMSVSECSFWSSLPRVRQPFPFTKAWVWEEGEPSEEGTEDQVTHGSIYIGNDGCGMYWHLIITGPERGIPWNLCGEGIQPLCPRRNFLQWYEDWLDSKDSFYGYTA